MMRWLDENALEKALKADAEQVLEAVEIFRDLHPGLERRFDAAIALRDRIGIRDCAHMLKSRLRLLHFPLLGEAAERMEKMAMDQELDAIDSVYVKLKQDITAAIVELREYLGFRERLC